MSVSDLCLRNFAGSSGFIKRIFLGLVTVHMIIGILWGARYTRTVLKYTPSRPANNLWTNRTTPSVQVQGPIVPPVNSLTVEGIKNATASFLKDVRWLNSGKVKNESDVLERFVRSYKKFCEDIHARENDSTWCPCVSESLVGRQNLSIILPSSPNLTQIEKTHPEVTLGGHWSPQNCWPRQKVAIIVPYRNRAPHRNTFLHYMIPFLQRQMMEFTIFLVEQGSPEVFNKASLMNVGFLEANKLGTFDCFCFNDVDTLPEDDRNFYTCIGQPHHLVWFVKRWNYVPFSGAFVGGGAAFTAEQFRRINGFSNRYYGWGGEDDDAYFRIVNARMGIVRFPKAVARYTTIGHARDHGNPVNNKRVSYLWKTRGDKSGNFTATDGISSIKYNVTEIERQHLFTVIHVDLPPPPPESSFRGWKPAKPKT